YYSQAHGYGALYYDSNKTNIIIFNLLNRMFFPCLVGLLVGSNFKKSVRYTVYSIFIFYLIINLLSVDSGSWVYVVILLLFLSHTFYKKFKWKQILSGSVFVFFFLHLIDVIIDLRK